MKYLCFFLIAFCLSLPLPGKAQTINPDSVIRVLKRELILKNKYDHNKEAAIRKLKRQLIDVAENDFSARYHLYESISGEYKSYKFDSAFVYANLMVRLSEKYHKKNILIKSQLFIGSILLNSGFYKEASDIIQELDSLKMDKSQRSDYLFLRSRYYASLAEYNNDGYFMAIYRKQSQIDFDSAEIVIPANAFEQTLNTAFSQKRTSDKKSAPSYYYHYILNQHLNDHETAMACTRLSFAYSGDDRMFFLALAAIYDIRSSTKETLAIYLLAQELYKLDKTEDAYLFMQEAAYDAKFYGARSREVQIESVLPLISSKLLSEKQHRADKVLNSALGLLMIVMLLFFLLVVYRNQLLIIKANEKTISEQNVKLTKLNGELWESAKIKEELIALFLQSSSSYIEMLDNVKWRVLKYGKAGKLADIVKFVDQLHIDQEKELLHETLDTAFLKMYPNFINSFNALLKKEDEIKPKSDRTLNATLRIFALMRLGIDELKTVAKILNYSERTIYTYKFRIKSKALASGHDFDKKIMEIKFNDSLHY